MIESSIRFPSIDFREINLCLSFADMIPFIQTVNYNIPELGIKIVVRSNHIVYH